MLEKYDKWVCLTNIDYYSHISEIVGYYYCVCGGRMFDKWLAQMKIKYRVLGE